MKRLIAVVGLVLLVGCQAPPAEMTEAEIAQIEAEVMEFADTHLAAFSELDTDLLLSFWMDDDISSVSFAQRAVGTGELSAFFDGLVASWQQTESAWQPGSIVDVISPTMALFQGTNRQDVSFTDGRELVQRIHFTHFLKKINSGLGMCKRQQQLSD